VPTAPIDNPEQALAEDIASFTRQPLKFVKYCYPWGEGELQESKGLRIWQTGILAAITNHLGAKESRFTPLQVAVSSGHGIGKSALLGMIIHWAMSTCEDCKVVLTANTDTQLRTKTWPEVSKWFRLGLNSKWFQVNSESITIREPEHQRVWRTDRISWSENNTEAFAGLHNKGKRIVLIFDEASAISDRIWEVAEGALTDEATEIMWFAFGNPTQNTGRFRQCFGKLHHRWKTFQIDSRTIEGTNKAQIDKWIADYGEDSDFVRVRVRGEFPRAGSKQLISSDLVTAAREYRAEGYMALPKVLSVDVARFGDDQTVVGTRQGRKARILAKYRGLDTVQVAERVIKFMEKEQPDATIIDADGIGAGVVDHIAHRGYTRRLFEFHGGAGADDGAMYFNRRAEVWGAMRSWLQSGAEIPDDPELAAQLEQVEYGFSSKGQIQLEKKEDMKKRDLESPDCADMLAMTFAVKVVAPKPPAKPEYRYPGQEQQQWMS
jgi:hypothetical protein